MIHILGLDLHNVVTFKKASIDFTEGLTYVRGLNLDSDAANPTSNGAGKSLLFSTLANVLYQTTPMALKRKAKKDILRQKGGTVGLILRPGSDAPEYEILQTSGGYKIYEDGKDVEVRTIPIAEEYIRKLFPLTETKFYSTCYLSTQRPYVLQRDTDSNRLQHLSDIFNLDQYSSIKDVLSVRLRSIKDHEIKLGVLEQHRLDAAKKLESVHKPMDSAAYAKAKKQYETLSSKLEALQNTLFTEQARKRDLSSLVEIERRLDELRKNYPFKKAPAEMLESLREDKTSVLAWDRWKTRHTEVQKTFDSLSKKIKAIELPGEPLVALAKKVKRLRSEVSELEQQRSDLRRAKREYEERQASIEELDTQLHEYVDLSLPKDVDFDSEIAVCKSTLKLEALLEDAPDDSKCPTCQGVLNLDELSAVVKSAKKRISKYQVFKKVAKLRQQRADLKELAPFDESALAKVTSSLKRLSSEIEALEEGVEKHRRHDHLITQLDEVVFPKKPKSVKPEYSVEQLDAYIDLCSEISEALASKAVVLRDHEELSELRSLKSVESALREVTESIENLDSEILELRGRISKVASNVSSYEHYKNTHAVYLRELEDLDAKIAAIKPELGDKKILDILMKAYGTKGLRSTAVDTVCKLLQANLNHYRDLIFAEPFTFELKSSESGVSILVDRNNGKPDSISDVRNLSGAESNSFQLLCLISLLPLLPDSERVNFVVLDEPTSHMCPVSRSIFNERFLPVLKEIVPSVFVISPHSDDVCPNSRQWTVRKQNGISSLIES